MLYYVGSEPHQYVTSSSHLKGGWIRVITTTKRESSRETSRDAQGLQRRPPARVCVTNHRARLFAYPILRLLAFRFFKLDHYFNIETHLNISIK